MRFVRIANSAARLHGLRGRSGRNCSAMNPTSLKGDEMKKHAFLLAALILVAGLVTSAHAGKAISVFEDPAGDADMGQGIGQSLPGGFDLTSGTIAKDGKDLVFTVMHADMPETKTLPEGFRLLWHFNVDDVEFRFTVKSFDVGKPDVLAQSGTDRVGTVYTDGVYRLEECYVDSSTPVQLSQCVVTAYLEGAWDPATKTVSLRLPLKLVKAKTGSLVTGGTGGAAGTGCQICWVVHWAERSTTPVTVIDATAQTVAYKVPRK